MISQEFDGLKLCNKIFRFRTIVEFSLVLRYPVTFRFRDCFPFIKKCMLFRELPFPAQNVKISY